MILIAFWVSIVFLFIVFSAIGTARQDKEWMEEYKKRNSRKRDL